MFHTSLKFRETKAGQYISHLRVSLENSITCSTTQTLLSLYEQTGRGKS